jgi:Tol biopolymer transport system component
MELLRLNQPDAFSTFWSVDWTRDSSAVLAIKETGAHRELWQIPIAGGQPRKLDIDVDSWSNGEAGFRIHPDGRQIVFNTGHNAIEIWALEHFLPGSTAKK